ncbi:hypothetical protein OS493_018467 [Desmophyllum pertusum]|uniref:Uncharacterized protein n=1 Tax=Desmophyllum pertusum TaxID=174260 RepID=A0A9X0D8N4_9CNID|nr:hypothetical protein OS493_018467 [Desmophyllum pertusum]
MVPPMRNCQDVALPINPDQPASSAASSPPSDLFPPASSSIVSLPSPSLPTFITTVVQAVQPVPATEHGLSSSQSSSLSVPSATSTAGNAILDARTNALSSSGGLSSPQKNKLFRRIKEFQMHLARHQKISKPPIKKAPKDSAIPEKGMPENPLPFKELKAQEHKNTC